MSITYWILRIGLGLMYLYSGWGLFFHPDDWSFFVPGWMMDFLASVSIPLNTYLQFQGSFEFLVGLLLLLWFVRGWFIVGIATFAVLEMTAILIFTGIDIVTFRDIVILAAGLALLFETPEGRRWLAR